MITFHPSIPIAQAAVAAAALGCRITTDRHGGAVIQPIPNPQSPKKWKPWFLWQQKPVATTVDEGE